MPLSLPPDARFSFEEHAPSVSNQIACPVSQVWLVAQHQIANLAWTLLVWLDLALSPVGYSTIKISIRNRVKLSLVTTGFLKSCGVLKSVCRWGGRGRGCGSGSWKCRGMSIMLQAIDFNGLDKSSVLSNASWLNLDKILNCSYATRGRCGFSFCFTFQSNKFLRDNRHMLYLIDFLSG